MPELPPLHIRQVLLPEVRSGVPPELHAAGDEMMKNPAKFSLCEKYKLETQMGLYGVGLTHIAIFAYQVEQVLAKLEAENKALRIDCDKYRKELGYGRTARINPKLAKILNIKRG